MMALVVIAESKLKSCVDGDRGTSVSVVVMKLHDHRNEDQQLCED